MYHNNMVKQQNPRVNIFYKTILWSWMCQLFIHCLSAPCFSLLYFVRPRLRAYRKFSNSSCTCVSSVFASGKQGWGSVGEHYTNNSRGCLHAVKGTAMLILCWPQLHPHTPDLWPPLKQFYSQNGPNVHSLSGDTI